MPLSPGTRLGPYEVLSSLGAGGMGEVYRARDTKLNRDVAIKILPDAFASDPGRLARFRREAQVLASLNHSNIAQLYGFEDSTSSHGLVMELVEGTTLAERIAHSPIHLADALPIARQVADAMEAAHDQGIIHRDLKPANVKVRPDGAVKVLDFGLAKALDPNVSAASVEASNSPTFTAAFSPGQAGHATQLGVILGTAAYMSPEQARGRTVDKRADIWAFGCVLYEMLTGRAAFAGDTVTDILAAVVSREPDWSALPSTTPASIRQLLQRCLEKDPKRRLRDVGDARLDLELDSRATAGEPGGRERGSPSKQALPWIVATALAVALGVALTWAGRPATEGAPLRRFTVEIPWNAAPNWNDFFVAISRDGNRLAYNCREENIVGLCVRSLDSLTAQRIVVTRDAIEWFFSPDGEWLGFADAVGLWKVSIRGGEPQPILRWPDSAEAPTGFTWGPDNFILYGLPSGLQRVSAAGGAAASVTTIAPGSGVVAHNDPFVLPDGGTALFTIVHADGNTTAGLVKLGDGSTRDLGIRGGQFAYVTPGWLVFRQRTTVVAQPFDLRDPFRSATAVPVLENVRTGPSVARDGTVVYIPTRGEATARLVWVDREGRSAVTEAESLEYTHLDVAPDSRALLNLTSVSGSKIDLIDLLSGRKKEVDRGAFPIWSPGDRVTFAGSGGLYWAPVDGSAPRQLLVSHPGFVVPTSWNTVTGDLAYYDHRAFEIWIRSKDAKTRPFLGKPGRKRSGRFSPNGKWMAFVSDETEGVYQVYVTAYPGPGPTVTVSTKGGGLSPIWSPDSKELFYRLGSKVMAVRMTGESPPRFTEPKELFDGPYTLDLMGHQREAFDGRRFLMVENSDDYPIVIIQNWPLELARLTRSK